MAAVETLISDAQSYVTSVRELADDAIDRMREDVNNVGFTAISFGGVTLPSDPVDPEIDDAPLLNTITLDLPDEPTDEPEYQPISAIEVTAQPELTAVEPTISMPAAPSQAAEFTGVAPTINTSYTFPDPPAALDNPFPTEPELQTITVPSAPVLSLPSLTAEAPTDDTTAPTDIAATFVSTFREVSPEFTAAVEGQVDAFLVKYNPLFHTQMAAIESQLQTYLEGGTGLNADVEDAIYERSRAKQDAEARRVADAAWAETAARGFTIPGGALVATLRRTRQAAADNNAAAARDIVVIQAEMEQKNLQFAMQQSQALRQMILSAALNYHQNLISINGQALEYAKSVVGNMVEVYNIQVRAFGVRLDAYRAQVAAYEARLRAANAAIELYKAEIDGQQALLSMDRAKVDLYRSRIDALETLARVYKSRIDVVIEQAGLEKLKLDLFRSQVDSYVAQIQGKRAEYDAYNAAVNGEEAKVRLYDTQVRSFNSRVDAWAKQIDAQAEVVRAQATSNDAKAKQFGSQLEAYRIKTTVRGDKARAELDVQRQALQAYETKATLQIRKADTGAQIYSAKARAYMDNAQLSVNTLIRNAELNLQRAKEVAALGISSAEVYRGLAGAALSGMNTLVAQTLAE